MISSTSFFVRDIDDSPWTLLKSRNDDKTSDRCDKLLRSTDDRIDGNRDVGIDQGRNLDGMNRPGFAGRLSKHIATLGPLGYAPIAPGTFGSFFAMVFYFVLKPSFPVQVLLLIVVSAVGTIAAHRAEKLLKEKDSSHIVIDEFAGYAVSIIALPQTLMFSVAAFLLFRFFDILKPPPVRWIERKLPGGFGVVADDLMAGVYANLALQIWMHFI